MVLTEIPKNEAKVLPQPRTPKRPGSPEKITQQFYQSSLPHTTTKHSSNSINTHGKASREDIDDIIIQLKRLNDNSKQINNNVLEVDSSLRNTQLELESLVSRSSNNNKHLQSLLLSTQDVRKLHSLINRLTEQQTQSQSDAQRQRDELSLLLDTKFEHYLKKELKEDYEKPENVTSFDKEIELRDLKLESLNKELESYKREHESLTALTQQVIEKERQLASINADYENLSEKLRKRVQQFEALQERYYTLDSKINDSVLEKYKNIQSTLEVSSSSLSGDENVPMTKMSRITSMLRNRYPVDGRRVISFSTVMNPTPSPKKPYFLSSTDNNSDENVAENQT